jgi:Leucine-rich repeat (LRR) protein
MRLDLSENHLSDLAPLAGLTGLRWLDVSRNRVSNLAPLAGLTGLCSLACDQRRWFFDFEQPGIEPLFGLTRLRSLQCMLPSSPPDTDVVSHLSKLTALTELHLDYAIRHQAIVDDWGDQDFVEIEPQPFDPDTFDCFRKLRMITCPGKLVGIELSAVLKRRRVRPVHF